MASQQNMPAKRCIFCTEKAAVPDPVSEADQLRRFISGQAKILPRKKTGTCAKHQRRLSSANKHARELGFLEYTGQ